MGIEEGATPLRARLKEMGLLDLFLAICEKHHVSLVHLMNVRVRRAWTTLAIARCEAFIYLRSCGYSYPAIGDLFDLDHTSVIHIVQRHGPGLAKVVPIDAARR